MLLFCRRKLNDAVALHVGGAGAAGGVCGAAGADCAGASVSDGAWARAVEAAASRQTEQMTPATQPDGVRRGTMRRFTRLVLSETRRILYLALETFHELHRGVRRTRDQ